VKYINIVDPIHSLNNLGKSVSKLNSNRFSRAIKKGNEKLQKIYKLSPNSGVNQLLYSLLIQF